MGGSARKSDQERGDAVSHGEDEATSNETTTEQRGGDETGADEQGGGDSSKLGVEDSEATPSTGSSERKLMILLLAMCTKLLNC